MDNAELFQLTARLRRLYPRSEDVLSVCEHLERLVKSATMIKDAELLKSYPPKRDRAAYMRNYRHAKAQEGKAG